MTKRTINAIITGLDGFKVKVLELGSNEVLDLNRSKYGEIAKQDLKENTTYNMDVTEMNGTIWLNEAREDKDKKLETPEVSTEDFKPAEKSSKLDELLKSKSMVDIKQILIMAQSCQHDAVALISQGFDAKDYETPEDIAKDVIDLRDVLLKDLVEKYYK